MSAEKIAKALGVKLTKWSQRKPVSDGVYNASYGKAPDIFRYWDGRWWGPAVTVGGAVRLHGQGRPTTHEDAYGLYWRGLDREATA